MKMMTVKQIADKMQCCERSWWRWVDFGRAPRPTKIGALCRWSEQTIDAWLADGCPDVRKTGWTPPAVEGGAK